MNTSEQVVDISKASQTQKPAWPEALLLRNYRYAHTMVATELVALHTLASKNADEFSRILAAVGLRDHDPSIPPIVHRTVRRCPPQHTFVSASVELFFGISVRRLEFTYHLNIRGK